MRSGDERSPVQIGLNERTCIVRGTRDQLTQLRVRRCVRYNVQRQPLLSPGQLSPWSKGSYLDQGLTYHPGSSATAAAAIVTCNMADIKFDGSVRRKLSMLSVR